MGALRGCDFFDVYLDLTSSCERVRPSVNTHGRKSSPNWQAKSSTYEATLTANHMAFPLTSNVRSSTIWTWCTFRIPT
eukprot:6558875-Pyramimonas_sp.AAC.1